MYIRIQAQPGSKKESIERVLKDTFKVTVKEPAKQNLANTRILEMLAQHFGQPVGKFRIISGHHSPRKIISADL